VRYGRGIEAALIGITVAGIVLAGLLWRRRQAVADKATAERVLAPLRGRT
jgi:hypothetical protein